jgi:hypothetical protein
MSGSSKYYEQGEAIQNDQVGMGTGSTLYGVASWPHLNITLNEVKEHVM